MLISIETVTPMLSHGEDRNKCEFRLSELKAAMRFWWRALNTFKKADNIAKCMLDIESIFFGSLNMKSPIILKMVSENKLMIGEIPANEKFEISMSVESGFINVEYYFDLIQLVSFFGGIGGKSRKGYGNFSVSPIDSLYTYEILTISNIDHKLKEFSVNTRRILENASKSKSLGSKNFRYYEELTDFIQETEFDFHNYKNPEYLKLTRVGNNINYCFLKCVYIKKIVENEISLLSNINEVLKRNSGYCSIKSPSPIYVSYYINGNDIYNLICEMNSDKKNIEYDKCGKCLKCSKCSKDNEKEKYRNVSKEKNDRYEKYKSNYIDVLIKEVNK